jgi:hypothetical protein
MSRPETQLHVVEWDKYHHYKGKKKPPWIKLYRELLGRYRFQKLSERDRFVLVGFFLLAAETDNAIPEDVQWIKGKLGITRCPPIEKLIDAGYLERSRNGIGTV